MLFHNCVAHRARLAHTIFVGVLRSTCNIHNSTLSLGSVKAKQSLDFCVICAMSFSLRTMLGANRRILLAIDAKIDNSAALNKNSAMTKITISRTRCELLS